MSNMCANAVMGVKEAKFAELFLPFIRCAGTIRQLTELLPFITFFDRSILFGDIEGVQRYVSEKINSL